MFDTDNKREASMEMNRREMARRAQDTIRIYNPLDHNFRFMWDGYWNSIPAQSYKDVPRYLAMHYFKKIADYMIGQQITKQGEELIELRTKQFGKTFLDKYEENRQVWDKLPRLDDQDLLKEVKKTVIIGLVEEYGYDQSPELPREDQKVDFRSTHDQLFDAELPRVSANMPEPEKLPVKQAIKAKVKADEVTV